jgi:hypothetical protein
MNTVMMLYTEQSLYHKKLKTMLSPDFAIKLNKFADMSHVLLRLVTEQVDSIDNRFAFGRRDIVMQTIIMSPLRYRWKMAISFSGGAALGRSEEPARDELR